MQRDSYWLLATVFILVSGYLTGCASSSKPQGPVQDPKGLSEESKEADARFEGEPAGGYYEIRKGDTLWAISQKYGVSVDEIVEMNGLLNPEVLAVGQLIFIPADDGFGLPVAPKSVAMTVKKPNRVQVPESLSVDLRWPLTGGVILRGFDDSSQVPHEGILFADVHGAPVVAAASGRVLFAADAKNDLGQMVVLDHEDKGILTVYAHLEGIAVAKGQKIKLGEALGKVGQSGDVESSQLFFQVRYGREPVDPERYLPKL
jgi:murein DD-endopeptidase MepM/ murein hydrolase activator NlpD